jgi:hypothetical protein
MTCQTFLCCLILAFLASWLRKNWTCCVYGNVALCGQPPASAFQHTTVGRPTRLGGDVWGLHQSARSANPSCPHPNSCGITYAVSVNTSCSVADTGASHRSGAICGDRLDWTYHCKSHSTAQTLWQSLGLVHFRVCLLPFSRYRDRLLARQLGFDFRQWKNFLPVTASILPAIHWLQWALLLEIKRQRPVPRPKMEELYLTPSYVFIAWCWTNEVQGQLYSLTFILSPSRNSNSSVGIQTRQRSGSQRNWGSIPRSV